MRHDQAEFQVDKDTVATVTPERSERDTVSAPSASAAHKPDATYVYVHMYPDGTRQITSADHFFKLQRRTESEGTETEFLCFAAPGVKWFEDPQDGKLRAEPSIHLREALNSSGYSAKLAEKTQEINDLIWRAAKWKEDESLQGLSNEAAIELVWSKAHEGLKSLAQDGEWSFRAMSLLSHRLHAFHDIRKGPYKSEIPPSGKDYTVDPMMQGVHHLQEENPPTCMVVDPTTNAGYIVFPKILFSSSQSTGEDAQDGSTRIGFSPSIVMSILGVPKGFHRIPALPAVSAAFGASRKDTKTCGAVSNPDAAHSTHAAGASSHSSSDVAAESKMNAPPSSTFPEVHDRGMRLVDSMMSFDNGWLGRSEELGGLLERGDVVGARARLRKMFEDTLHSLKTAPESVFGSGWVQNRPTPAPLPPSQDPTVSFSKRPPPADDGTTSDESKDAPIIQLQGTSGDTPEGSVLRRSKRPRGEDDTSM